MTIVNSKEFIKEVKRTPQNFYIIHYSCQSLNDDNDGLSPRITSIAILHLSTDQTVSFSIHAIAEELGISRENIHQRLDDIELALLSKFNDFVRDRRDRYWIHWNMRNLTYGFEHLEHRYRVLGKTDMAVIPVERRINLNDILSDRYGSGYVADPRLKSLMNLNGGIHRHFLTGAEEVEAFKSNEFIKMHNSTLCKTGFYRKAIDKLAQGKLKTNSKGMGVLIDRLFESRLAKTVALASALISVPISVYQGFIWLTT